MLMRRKSIEKRGPGFGYGFVCAFCFTLAFFCLLCGLVLDGFKDIVSQVLQVECKCRLALSFTVGWILSEKDKVLQQKPQGLNIQDKGINTSQWADTRGQLQTSHGPCM